jgi:hypothetical protein
MFARFVVYLTNIVTFTSHCEIIFFTFAQFAYLRKRVLIQHCLLVIKHDWQNDFASFLFLWIRSTVTWWSMFMINNKQFMFKQKVIKWWSNNEKKNDEKMLYMCKITRWYSRRIRREYHVFHNHWSTFLTFYSRLSSFSQTTRIFLVFHSRSRQTFEFEKLIDEHMNYSSLNNEKSSLFKLNEIWIWFHWH